jgi:NitT/TauT family transport system substrate-binding protein
MIRHRFLRALGAFGASAPLVAAAAGRAGADDIAVLRLSISEGDDATPTLYAIQSGIFKKYGLDVQLQPAPSGAAALAALAGGSTDAAASSLFPFFSARSRGLALQIIGPLAISTPEAPYAALLVKAEAPIRTGRDFNGKTIASPALRDLNWVASMAWIDQNGGDSTTVTSIELPGSAIPAALQEGRIAGATVTTPRYVQAVHNGGVRVLGHSYESIAKRFDFSAIVARSEFAAAHPDLVLRFGRAIRDATLYTNAHHAETLPIYAAFAKIDPKEIADAPRAVGATFIQAKDLQPMLDMAVRYKVLDRPMDPQTLLSPAILKPG